MTSKSVRRNVTRSWGLSLEKIEFFSTDFLRWVPMPQRDIPPFTFIYGHNYYVQLSKTICRHLFSSKNCSIHKVWRDWTIKLGLQTTCASEANFEFSRQKSIKWEFWKPWNSSFWDFFCWFSNTVWKFETHDQYVRWMPRADGRFYAWSFQLITDLVT